MSKCIICRIGNATMEAKRHPNQQTIFILQYLMKQLKRRIPKDIEKICINCRVPLKMNVILTTAGSTLDKIFTVGKEKVYLETK